MRLWSLVVVLAAAAVPVRAQDARSYVSWSADPVEVGADGDAVVRLTGVVSPGWKMYASTSPPPAPALRVTLDSAAGRIVGPVRHVDAPKAAFDSLLLVPVEQLTGRARLDLPVQVRAEGRTADLPLSIRFAVCDASICLAPRTVVVPVALRTMETSTRAPEAAPALTDAQTPSALPPAPQSPADSQSVRMDTARAVSESAMSDSNVASVEAPAAPREGRRWPAALVALVVAVGVGLWVARRR